ncbi:hypothetical protein [Paraclostridium tenue]|uniref:Uncharacterized protein n=1 Tax=Paraclostridium tenue TaxID=1737 RepID=A0ABN1M2W4_9FIRM
MCKLKFYEGRIIQSMSKCKNNLCGKEIGWYNFFPQPIGNGKFIKDNVGLNDNVSSANIKIINEYEDKLDVEVHYRCRFCDEPHEVKGIIFKKDNKLVFEED